MSEPVISVRKSMLERLQSSGLSLQVLDHMPEDGAVVTVPYLAFEGCGIASKLPLNKGAVAVRYLTTVAYTTQLVTSPSDQAPSSKDLDGLVDEIVVALATDLDLSGDSLTVRQQFNQDIQVSLIVGEDEEELKVARLVWHVEVH